MEIGTERTKRRKISNIDEHYWFNELPEELKIEILGRVPANLLAPLLRVSKSWHRLIVAHCFPKPSSRLRCFGIVTFFCESPSETSIHSSIASYANSPGSHVDACFSKAQIKFNFGIVTDNCNGLYLYRDSSRLYHVYNPVTNQWVSVVAPNALDNDPLFYEALAYDPFESCFFRIVLVFFRQLKIYSSETRNWTSLEIRLDHQIEMLAMLIQESLYLKGAIYRLSLSSHLLRFAVDKKASSPEDQARVIELPILTTKGRVGVNNNQIHFAAFDDEFDLCIWILTDTSNIYEWSLRFKLSEVNERYDIAGNFYVFLAFDPHLEAVYLASESPRTGPIVWCINFRNNVSSYLKIFRPLITLPWHNVGARFHFHTPVPFANGLRLDNPLK